MATKHFSRTCPVQPYTSILIIHMTDCHPSKQVANSELPIFIHIKFIEQSSFQIRLGQSILLNNDVVIIVNPNCILIGIFAISAVISLNIIIYCIPPIRTNLNLAVCIIAPQIFASESYTSKRVILIRHRSTLFTTSATNLIANRSAILIRNEFFDRNPRRFPHFLHINQPPREPVFQGFPS